MCACSAQQRLIYLSTYIYINAWFSRWKMIRCPIIEWQCSHNTILVALDDACVGLPWLDADHPREIEIQNHVDDVHDGYDDLNCPKKPSLYRLQYGSPQAYHPYLRADSARIMRHRCDPMSLMGYTKYLLGHSVDSGATECLEIESMPWSPCRATTWTHTFT